MDRNKLIVTLLLLLQAISTLFLWTLDATSSASQTRFAVFLAVDLLSFAMNVYMFLSQRWGEFLSKAWMLAASLGLAILLFSSLFLP
jgi:hypothetical protein